MISINYSLTSAENRCQEPFNSCSSKKEIFSRRYIQEGDSNGNEKEQESTEVEKDVA